MTNTNYQAAWLRLQNTRDDLLALVNQRNRADEGEKAKFDSLIARTRADLQKARKQLAALLR